MSYGPYPHAMGYFLLSPVLECSQVCRRHADTLQVTSNSVPGNTHLLGWRCSKAWSVVLDTGGIPQAVSLKCLSTLKLMVIAEVTSPKTCFSSRSWKGDKETWPGVEMEAAVP